MSSPARLVLFRSSEKSLEELLAISSLAHAVCRAVAHGVCDILLKYVGWVKRSADPPERFLTYWWGGLKLSLLLESIVQLEQHLAEIALMADVAFRNCLRRDDIVAVF
jgi:hypothetical protein